MNSGHPWELQLCTISASLMSLFIMRRGTRFLSPPAFYYYAAAFYGFCPSFSGPARAGAKDTVRGATPRQAGGWAGALCCGGDACYRQNVLQRTATINLFSICLLHISRTYAIWPPPAGDLSPVTQSPNGKCPTKALRAFLNQFQGL